MSIPIYRAKKIDSDEWVEGYLLPPEYNSQSISTDWTKNFHDDFVPNEYEIDPNTLAIHFPDMIDKNGKKIFASLSKDGVGGDIRDGNWVIFYSDGCIKHSSLDDKLEQISNYRNFEEFEVIGIHKGE